MPENKSFKIKYQKAYDFKSSFISGVHGGIGNNGIINANFFGDRVALPDSQNIEVNENGLIVKTENKNDSDTIREVQFGLFMDIRTAKTIASWLESRIREYETNQNKLNHGNQ